MGARDRRAGRRAAIRRRRGVAGRGVRRVTVRTDPEGNETDVLFDFIDLTGAHVLEIGAGDGRLTWRYAHRAARVTAIEPFEGSVARASERLRDVGSSVAFLHTSFEDFATDSDPDLFDVALLSWSLC